MHRSTSKVALLLVVIAAWLQAPAAPASNASEKNSSELTTIQGCLKTDQGQYVLVEDIGTPHTLSGGASKLKNEVGKFIEVTGKPSSRTLGDTPAGGASNVVTVYVFEVKSVKHLSDICRSQ